jgi:glucose/mannose-6-phosphate isomerase
MKMNNYISDFTNQLNDALSIGISSKFNSAKSDINNILICGLGGSGIGGSIITDIVNDVISVPILATKGYEVPNFVNKNTLVIACSYSGNTEETIEAVEKCLKTNAEVSVITSGGKLKEIALEKNLNHIIIPGGHPPRAMFGYGFTELFFVLKNYNLINNDFENDFENAISLLDKEKENIKKLASSIAKKLYKKTPVIYTSEGFEGVAIRFRQQMNENSKMLCWHHVVPEMNHNELLGWRTNVDGLAVVYLRNKNDYYRNQTRVDINKSVINKYTEDILEIWSKGNSLIETSLYHINVGDWVSWYLSELNNVDAIEIDVINFLKDRLSKI